VVLPKRPKPTIHVHAVKERAQLEITFPRVEGYRIELPNERIVAKFTNDSRLVLTPEEVGPCKVLLEGIVGEGVELDTAILEAVRPSEISYHLAKHLMYTRFRDPGQAPPLHLFGQIQRTARRWIEEGYLIAKGVPIATVTYLEMAEKAAERIYLACQRHEHGQKRIKAILDAYNPKGSTRHVSFNSSKSTWRTAPGKCHINFVVLDSDWEAELARVLESHPNVRSYAKNQGMQFEVPYRDGAMPRKYIPDFIVQIEDGNDDPLNLVLETKGYRGGNAQLKAETMRTMWVPGVNNLGSFGRWAFEEFTDVFEIEGALGRLIRNMIAEKVEA
jgi:type III restriction enzyme